MKNINKVDLIYRGYTIQNHYANYDAYVVKDAETGFQIFMVMEEDFVSIEDIQKRIDEHKKQGKKND
jgi:hypothetical protein